MKKTRDAERLAEETLSSLDNIQPVEVNDFIFTRIQNRMQAERSAVIKGRTRVMYRLSAVLLLFILVNITSYYFFMQNKNTSAKQNTSGVAAFADEYKLEQSSYNY